MPTPQQIQAAIAQVADQRSFIQRLLIETLGWPVRDGVDNVEDMSYKWTADELRASGLDRHVVDSSVWQIQKLEEGQPWGIFLVEFKNEDVFTKDRGLTGPLRKILRGLVPKARKDSQLPSWDRPNLLFICTHEYRHYKFAYFKDPKGSQTAPLTTFGWGPDIPSRTACEFNLPALEWPQDQTKWLAKWLAAFDKEKLSTIFFEQYKALADILRSDLKSQSKDLHWSHDYTLQLLNRVMFLHFIQRKRWLGDDTDFLSTFWQEYRASGQPKDTFFEKWLKVMFFEAFNNKFNYGHAHFSPRTKAALSGAPYLNGGLFAQNDLDRLGEQYEIAISDDRIGQALAFFRKYNFTVSEDTPLDRDVAVDPEMIGMVYESLVNISEDEDRRGEAGIFYTPRVEIDMMCRLALVDWLANHLGDKHKALLYEWVFAYDENVKADTTAAVVAARLVGPLKELLGSVTILDPACGSGSFLVGMLHLLDDLRQRLDRHEKVLRTAYERRKEIIGCSLYGVDIKDWACHVAELRLWLSLIIDADMTAAELHVRRQPLLPNFSFNIRCGDSLVQEVGGIDMAHRRGSMELSQAIKIKLAELRKEKARFYNNDPERKYGTAAELALLEVKVFGDLLEDRIAATGEKATDMMRIQAEKGACQQRNLLTGELEGPAKQFTLDSEQRKKDITALMDEKARMEATLKGIDKTTVPFAWDIAFAEIFSDDKGGFDVVIGNPPYVRQENIADPNPRMDRKKAAEPEAKKAYKAKVVRGVYKAFPWYFDYKEAADKAARHDLDKKSDLYIYFYFKGLSFLNDRGSFCFITSNSWLDVGYGADLQEFLLRRCHVKMVLDNKAKRSFKSADVNTVIVLLGAPQDRKAKDDAALANTARFVMFGVPFEDAVCAKVFLDIESVEERTKRDTYRIFAASQQRLLEEGLEQSQEEDEAPKPVKKKTKSAGVLIKSAKYIGNKWGAQYLRAPDIYMTIMDRSRHLCRFNKIALHIQRNNLQELVSTDYTLREQCPDGFPFLHSVKDVNTIRIDPQRLPKVISREGQEGARWLVPDLISNRFIGVRLCFFEGGNFLINDSFFVATFKPAYRKKTVLALMNSTLSLLMLELLGRKNMGEGVLCIYGPELAGHIFLDPAVLSKPQADAIEVLYDQMAIRPLLPIWDELRMHDRSELDNIVFDLLELTPAERFAVSQSLAELVDARLSKASSLTPRKIEQRLDAVDSTLGIWSAVPHDVQADEDDD